MYSDVLIDIGTRKDQLVTIAQLDLVIQQLYKTDMTFDQSLDAFASTRLSDKLKIIFQGQTGAPLLRKQLQLLVDEISHMDSIELRLAYEPSHDAQKKIVDWAKQHVNPSCLVEFVFVPDLIGGAAISFNGIYKDLSFKSKILTFYSANTNWIREYFSL